MFEGPDGEGGKEVSFKARIEVSMKKWSNRRACTADPICPQKFLHRPKFFLYDTACL